MSSSASTVDTIITPEFLLQLRITRTFGWVGFTIQVYECLLTAESVVAHVIYSKWTVVKVLFLLVRWGTLANQVVVNLQQSGVLISGNIEFCFRYNTATTVSSVFAFFLIHLLVIARAWALWSRRLVLALLFVVLLSAYFAVFLYFFVQGVVLAGYSAYPVSPIIGTCFQFLPPGVWAVWFAGAFLESVAFGLTYLSLRTRLRGYGVKEFSPLIMALYRDGALFFTLFLLINLTNVFFWAKYPESPLNMLASTLSLSLMSVAVQRLVLSLREVDTAPRVTTTRMSRELGHLPNNTDNIESDVEKQLATNATVD